MTGKNAWENCEVNHSLARRAGIDSTNSSLVYLRIEPSNIRVLSRRGAHRLRR